MKKITLLLSAIIICEFAFSQTLLWGYDFESNTVGNDLCTEEPTWQNWGPISALISSTQAHGGSKSIYLNRQNPAEDQFCEIYRTYADNGNAITTGSYLLEYYVYVMNGATSDFYVYGVDFENNGAAVGRIDIESTSEYGNSIYFFGNGAWSSGLAFTPETWIKVSIYMDIDNDNLTVNINDTEAQVWTFSGGYDSGDPAVTGIYSTDFYTNCWNYGGDNYFGNYYLDDIKFYDMSVGIIETNSQEKLNVYPQPATDRVTITSTNNINTIILFNCLGQAVFSKDFKLSKKITINISSLDKGVYVLQVNTPEGVHTKKIIIE